MPKISNLPPLGGFNGTEIIALVQGSTTYQVQNKTMPINTATQAALALKADLVGGKIPAAQLPGFIDPIDEYANFSLLPVPGDSNKLYVTIDNDHLYRWSGSQYVDLSVGSTGGGGDGVILGETSSTAYRGDRGKTAYDHTLILGNPHATTLAQITNAGAFTTDSISGFTEALTDNSTKLATTAFVKGQNYIQASSVFTNGSIPYANLSGVLVQNNGALKYDGVNLHAGAINPGTYSGIQMNDSAGRIQAAAVGIKIQAGVAGNGLADPTKTIRFYNQEKLYLDLMSSSTSVHNAIFGTNVVPNTNLGYSLGSSVLKWENIWGQDGRFDSLTVTGAVAGIDKNDVGLSQVDNVSDLNKPISTATQAALTTLTNSKISVSEKGVNNGVATLGADGKVLPSQLPTGSQVYKGTWNATTNSPTLANNTGTAGWTYRVTVAGSQDLGSGAIAFSVGDDVIHNGTAWQRIPSSQTITSVNGQTGAVILNSDNITVGSSNLYYTNALARAAISGTAPVSYNTSTGVISMPQATSSVAGYLSPTDFNIFAAKAAPGSYITALSGDVIATGPGSAAATIQPGAVTYSKIQNVSATNTVLGRVSSGAGPIEQIGTTGTGIVVRQQNPTINAPIGLVKGDVGLGNVDNVADANKPISIATQTALNLKADQTSISNINNTSDANKPISTATQTALTTLTNSVALKINLSEKGANNGVATLGSDGKVTPAQLPTGSQVYKGTYNATTNTPALINGTGTSGWTYKVDVAGTQNFGAGAITFAAGDDVIYNGTVWQKIPSFQTINSVNGQIGTVILNTDNVAEGSTNKYFSQTLARNSISASSPLAYNATTGVLTFAGSTGISQLTGDVVGGPGSGVMNTTIPADTVTYTKMQNVSTNNRVLGRVTAGAGDVEEIQTSGTGFVVRSNSPVITTPTGITKADVGLGSVDNTTDAAKPISTATQTALNLKADASAISNINNTSDANKPVSTATATALSGKVDKIAATSVQTGSYTLTLADLSKVVTINSGTPVIVTVPSALPAGFNCLIVQLGAGQVTLAAGSGVAILNRQSYTKLAGQYAIATVVSHTANNYISSGDMVA